MADPSSASPATAALPPPAPPPAAVKPPTSEEVGRALKVQKLRGVPELPPPPSYEEVKAANETIRKQAEAVAVQAYAARIEGLKERMTIVRQPGRLPRLVVSSADRRATHQLEHVAAAGTVHSSVACKEKSWELYVSGVVKRLLERRGLFFFSPAAHW